MLRTSLLAALVATTAVVAQKEPECTLDKHCPESAPCCGQYGECGTGAFCLGGCDPRMSFSLDSCVPAPVCESKSFKMNTLDNVQDISEYLGDSSKADWVASGEPAVRNGNVLLTMPRMSVGTVLSSTHYMWYGNVKARLKTSRGRGVITAFILFSDVKDEIDYEFVGVDLKTAQTNYYFQGITDYGNSGNISLSDTFNNFHDYEIRWTPDKIEWLIDGQVGRTKLKKETWNSTANRWEFPQTPSRVQISLWPGGAPTNGQGTIDWAGGEMDWDHEDIKKVGYFYATAESISIECWDAKGNEPGSNDGVSYTYKDKKATNDTVIVGDKKTTIASLAATGLDPEKGGKKDDSDKDNSDKDDGKDEDEEPPSVPGGGGGGNKDDSGTSGSGNSNTGSDSGSDSGSSDSGSSGSSSGCDTTSFHGSCSGDSGSGDGGSGSSKASTSALAIIMAGCALYWL